ncbi:MAG: DEAD/DEAH box helicase [bacterium]|nr:DEAD/DEAH box helicase [bacterium]
MRSNEYIIVSAESYFTKSGGYSTIYVVEGRKHSKVIKECPEVKVVGDNIPYEYLNPLQTAFFYFWDEKKDNSVLCVAPTSAGKTGLIHIFFSRFRGRKIYLSPTKALCEEKYNEFSKIFGRENVSIRTGDKFEFSPPKTEYVVATYESCLASIRSGSTWFSEAQAICIDEVHFVMFGGSRGIFLEELIAHSLLNGKSILSLSATIPKAAAEEYAKWLRAKLFYSDWRPVPLERRIEPLSELEKKIFGGKIKGDTAQRIANVVVHAATSPKVIIFVYKKALGWKIIEEMDKLGIPVLNESVPFEKKRSAHPEESLAAFHNADIPIEERTEIENYFRNNKLRFLVSTQTMAYGVNLPADESFIIVRNWMSKTLPDISTILQMEGRVGRFGISERGISRIVPLSGEKVLMKELDNFINSPDTRTSLEKLVEGDEGERRITDVDAMSLIVLGIIISNNIELKNREEGISQIKRILGYMKTSFPVEISKILDLLEDSGCIKDGKITPLGRILGTSFIPPSAYRDFKRRFYSITPEKRIESIAYIIRPLLFFRDLTRGFLDILPEHLRTSLENKINKAFETESILELWMSGELWWYFRYPPAQFYMRPDALQLVKLLSQLKFYGLAEFSLYDIIRIGQSLSYGINPEFSIVSAVQGIGFSRAGAIYFASKELNLSLNQFVRELIQDNQAVLKALYRVMLSRFENIDPTLKSEWAKQQGSAKQQERMNIISKINDEIKNLKSILSSFNEKVIDEELARIIVFVKYGPKEATEMSKEDLYLFVKSDGKVN